MDKADNIPENTSFVWNIAMTNISREKDGKFILCKNVKQAKELYIKIDKSVWEVKRAVGSVFLGDPKQILWEALDSDKKNIIMQKGFQKYDRLPVQGKSGRLLLAGATGCCIGPEQRCRYGDVEASQPTEARTGRAVGFPTDRGTR